MSSPPPAGPTTLRARIISALLAALMVGIGAAVVITQTDDGAGHKSTTVEFRVNEAAGDGAPTKTITVPAPIVKQTAAAFPDKAMRDETPRLAEQIAPGQLTAAQEAAARIKATQPPLPTAGASGGFAGCITRFVGNQSSRQGVRPQWQVDHYTVSHNVPGWADVLSVAALFDRRSSQASSNFIIDGEGHCAYVVPIEAKAWTQAAGNPFSISYEVIDFGNEATYLADPGFRRLTEIQLEVSRRTGIPFRRGSTNGGCAPGRSGIIQHADLGICGGGHHDINPFSIDVVIRRQQALVDAALHPITAGQRKRCVELNTIRRGSRAYHRHFRRPGGHPLTARQRARAAKIRAGFRHHGVRCLVGPPGQRGSIGRR